VFDENVFPFAALNPTTGARYTSEVLLLPDSSSSGIIDSNVAYDPPVICLNLLNMLPNTLLQPQPISGVSNNQLCTSTGVDPPTGTAPDRITSEASQASAPGRIAPDRIAPDALHDTTSPSPAAPEGQAAPSDTVATSDQQDPTAALAPATLVPSITLLGPMLNTTPRTRLQAGISKPKNLQRWYCSLCESYYL
jgi:hypothetical protein